jgi:hypothetical protein
MGGHLFIPYDGGPQGVPLPGMHRPRPFQRVLSLDAQNQRPSQTVAGH